MTEQLKVEINLDNTAAHAAALKFRADQQAMNAGLLADATRTENARAAVARDAQGRLVAGSRSATDQVKEHYKSQSEAAATSFGRTKTSGAELWQSMHAGLALAQQGMSTLTSLTAGFRKAIDDAYEAQRKLGSQFNITRESLGELADLQGEVADNAFVLRQAEFQARTGLTPQESVALQTEYQNYAAQYIGTKITPEESAKLKVTAGNLAGAKNVPAQVVGELAARMLAFKDYTKGGAAEAGADMSAVLNVLSSGSGSTGQLASETGKLAAGMVNEDALRGTLRSVKDASRLVSVLTEGFPLGQSEAAGGLLRVIRRFKAPSEGKFLAEAGVTPETDAFESIRLIGDLARKKTAAGPPGTNIQDIIKQNFKDELGARALAVAYNQGIGGELFEKREAVAKEFGTPEAVERTVGEYKTSERGVSRTRDAQTRLIEARRGAETSKIDILRREAFNRLLASGKIDTTDENVKKFIAEKASFGVLGSYQAARVDETVEGILQSRLPEGQRGRVSLPWSAEARANLFNQQIQQVEATGRSAITDRPLPAAGAGAGGDGRAVGLLESIDKKLSPPVQAPPVRPMVGPPYVERRG